MITHIYENYFENYFHKLNQEELAREAQRESLLASQSESAETSLWQDNQDTEGWN